MNLKKEILCVFHPHIPKGKQRPFRYRVISINKLPDYIGIDRCKKEVDKFMDSGKEKDNFYVALKGKVYFYRK